jgi:Arc/MetJ-type ribon-helix-helix transcriptional regulator
MNTFQVKQMNEAAIDRLLKSGMFPNKAYVVQAALTALFEKLIEQNSRATLTQNQYDLTQNQYDLTGSGDNLPTAPPSSPEQEEAAERKV